MPIMDGYRATYTIRNTFHDDLAVRHTPIVAMTASAIQGDKEKCQKAGMDDYLAKPVKKGNLEKMLVKWVVEGKKKRANLQQLSAPSQGRPDMSRTQSNFTDDSKTAQEQLDSEVDRLSFARYKIEHSSESDGDRAMRHQRNEEKAISLRDDALIESGDDPKNHLGRGGSEGSHHHSAAEQSSSTKLTTANMQEHEQTYEKADPLKKFRRQASGEQEEDGSSVNATLADSSSLTPQTTPRASIGPNNPLAGAVRRPG